MTNPTVDRAQALLPSLTDSGGFTKMKSELAAEAIRELIDEVRRLERTGEPEPKSFDQVVKAPVSEWDNPRHLQVRAAHAAKTVPWYKRLGAWLGEKF